MVKAKKNPWRTNPVVVAAIALFACLLWGSAYPCLKIAYRFFRMETSGAADQILFAGIRFMIAGLTMLAVLCVKGKKFVRPRRENFPMIFSMGFFQTTLQYICFYIGLSNAAASNSSVIGGSSVLFSTILAAIFIKTEQLTLRKLLGCIIGLLGIAAISFDGITGGFSFSAKGELLLFIAAFCFSVASIISKKVTAKEDSVLVSAYQLTMGSALLITIGLILGGNIPAWNLPGVGLLLYLAMVSLVTFALWAMLLTHNPVASVSIYQSFIPISGVILSGLLLKEDILQLKYLISLVMVAAAIIIVNTQQRKRS